MDSGSSDRVNSGGSNVFNSATSDDAFLSYEDYGNHDLSNGSLSDSVLGSTSNSEDYRKTRMAGSSVFSSTVCNQQEDTFRQDVMSAVEKSMKKYADNLMLFLEGISSRLSQLELYCYNLDKSIGEMRHEFSCHNGEADAKFDSLEKHIQEVCRSVQILRDKQELAETRKELAKLQLARKESAFTSHSQSIEKRAISPASDYKKIEINPEAHGQQLALALPHQVAPKQQPLALPPPPAQVPQNQQHSYHVPSIQFQDQDNQIQHSQSQYIPDPQYYTFQFQDTNGVAPPTAHTRINQTAPAQYQQQWAQQLTQQVPQQHSVQPQMRMRIPSTAVYSPYSSNQPANALRPDTHPSSMPAPRVSQSCSSQADAMYYGYTGAGRPVQQPQTTLQRLKENFWGKQGDGHMTAGSHPSLPLVSSYLMYNSQATSTQPSQPLNYQCGHPPANSPVHNMPLTTNSSLMLKNPSMYQPINSHSYG